MKLNRINETLIGDNILKPSSVDKKNYSLANSITSSPSVGTPLFLEEQGRGSKGRVARKGSYLKINSLPNVALRAAYEKIGTFLVNNKFAQNRKGDVQTNVSLFNALHTKSNNQTGFSEQLLDKTAPYLHLYSKQDKIKQYLIGLFAPKVAETFAFSLRKTKKDYKTKPLPYHGAPSLEGSSLSVLSHKAGIPNFGLWSLRGIEKTWRAASSLIFKLIEKRLIYKKTLILPKLLQFFNAATQTGSLQDVPSPLASSLLLPAKRYESYKRAFLAMQRSPNSNAAPRYPSSSFPSPMAASFPKGEEKGLAEHEKEKKKGQETGRNSTFEQAFSNRKEASPLFSIAGGEQEVGKRKEEGEEFFDKPTAFNGYYRNRILDRHRGYLNNQWWNGQLGEHNLESISLSDIELRTRAASFSDSGIQKKPLLRRRKTLPSEIAASLLQEDEQKRNKTFITKKLPKQSTDLLDPNGKKIFRTNGALEQKQPSLSLLPVLLPSTLSKDVENKRITPLENEEEKTIEKKDYFFDYPDFDQHYNPGNRRWVLHFGYWSYWYNFKATHKAEIYSYMVTESFLTTFNFLNSNREIMDYFVTKILKSGLIKEISLIEGLKRF